MFVLSDYCMLFHDKDFDIYDEIVAIRNYFFKSIYILQERQQRAVANESYWMNWT